jgi:hypothetical protein
MTPQEQANSIVRKYVDLLKSQTRVLEIVTVLLLVNNHGINVRNGTTMQLSLHCLLLI